MHCACTVMLTSTQQYLSTVSAALLLPVVVVDQGCKQVERYTVYKWYSRVLSLNKLLSRSISSNTLIIIRLNVMNRCQCVAS